MDILSDYASRSARRLQLARKIGTDRGLDCQVTEGDFVATLDADGYLEYSTNGGKTWHTFWSEHVDSGKYDEQHEFSSQLAKMFDRKLGLIA